MNEEEIKHVVRKRYGTMAKDESSCCDAINSCCSTDSAENISKSIGYSDEDLQSVPKDSNLGLGCGNPIALASLKEGETVLDLGSGAGFDCFLAANKVGSKGTVIGVDMTPEMIHKARENARQSNFKNVEFRLGEIENLPVADNSVDVVISNCVINLSPTKNRVFEEVFRILKPGGRFMISDIVLLKELPDFIKKSVEAYVGCISGAILKEKYIEAIKDAGFNGVQILDERFFPIKLMMNDPTAKAIINKMDLSSHDLGGLGESVVSIRVEGRKGNIIKK